MRLKTNDCESIKMSKFYRFLVLKPQKGPMLRASDPRLLFHRISSNFLIIIFGVAHSSRSKSEIDTSIFRRSWCWFVIKFDQKHATKIDFSTEKTQTF